MFTIIIRAIVLYLLILVVFRLMGKRQIGQMQPFELVLTLVIADLATIPMSETTLPLLHGIVPLLTLMVLHFTLTTICHKSNKINTFVNGKPVIVINPKGIDFSSIKSLNISLDDLLEGLRGCGYFSFEQVEYAIVETTGKINVLPKAEYSTATLKDLNIKPEKNTIPITLISEGNVVVKNLEVAGISSSYIDNILKKFNIKKVKDVVVCTIDGNGKVYIQEKDKDFIVSVMDDAKVRV